MKTLKCAVLVLAIAGFAAIAAGCASGGSTTAAVQQPAQVVAQQPAAASAKEPIAVAAANDSQFVARLVAGSLWQVEWQSWSTKGTFELLFRMEDGKLKASLRNVTGCNASNCRDGEVEIKAVSGGHIKLVMPWGSSYDFKLNQEDGSLAGEGISFGGYFIFASAYPSPKK